MASLAQSRVMLIDGTCALYRAFYGIRSLSTRSGVPTNALFGFVRMVEQLRDQWRPTHWRVIFDGGSPARRLQLLPTYKAQRPPMPEALRSQGPMCEEFLDCRRLERVCVPGEEADDIMATLAVAAARDGAEVLLATMDKDLYQIVSDRIFLIRMAGEPERMGTAQVEAKTGVRPEQIVDWLAMVGDSADNIPGVPGVGAKTAAELLRTHGSVAGLRAHLDEIPRARIRDSLLASREILDRNIALVRLDTALGGLPDWRSAAAVDGDAGRLLEFFTRVEFESMAKRVREPDLFG